MRLRFRMFLRAPLRYCAALLAAGTREPAAAASRRGREPRYLRQRTEMECAVYCSAFNREYRPEVTSEQ
ncbi:hypothetical protein MTO96_035144 [Rhipicephalus appendiculatus]